MIFKYKGSLDVSEDVLENMTQTWIKAKNKYSKVELETNEDAILKWCIRFIVGSIDEGNEDNKGKFRLVEDQIIEEIKKRTKIIEEEKEKEARKDIVARKVSKKVNGKNAGGEVENKRTENGRKIENSRRTENIESM